MSESIAWQQLDNIWARHQTGEIKLEDAVREAQDVRLTYRLALTNRTLTEMILDDVRPRVRRQQATYVQERIRLAVADGTAPDPTRLTRADIARLFDVPEELLTAPEDPPCE